MQRHVLAPCCLLLASFGCSAQKARLEAPQEAASKAAQMIFAKESWTVEFELAQSGDINGESRTAEPIVGTQELRKNGAHTVLRMGGKVLLDYEWNDKEVCESAPEKERTCYPFPGKDEVGEVRSIKLDECRVANTLGTSLDPKDDLGYIASALEIVAKADSHERRSDGAQVFHKRDKDGNLIFEDTVVLNFEKPFPLISRSSSQVTCDPDGKPLQRITRERNYVGR